jgi:hypothetical protein
MSETKVFLYVVEVCFKDDRWLLSDYSLNTPRIDNIHDARLLLQKARRENESAVCLNSRAVAKYRIMKATTTFEVLDE